ncbi:GAF and ANTAR domain-containing protein [Plantactinospora sp. WMMB782]|uniref:GAF and ANTAR domain-containing protein n=1 Tax=Plantactinospora sp. WMMB782 TaxID=3404121 RepID=UPI003B9458B2
MPDESDLELAEATTRLLTLLSDAPDLNAFLDTVVVLCARVVTPAVACGITLRRDGQPITVAASDPLAAQIDEIQYGTDQGPCLDSLRGGILLQVDDLTEDDRWGSYRTHAIAHGVVSSLSIPLMVDDRCLAALNLYSGQPFGFTPTARRYAEAFGAQCAAALGLMLRQVQQAQVERQLTEAIASRSVIDHAVGIVMAQQRCTASAAFKLLRQASQHRNQKLRDVAAGIIVRVTGEPPEPPVGFRPPS